MRGWLVVFLVAPFLGPVPATADLLLPPGFSAHVYVTGDEFDPGTRRGIAGIRSTSTLALDHAGILYLARTGRRSRTPRWPRCVAGGSSS